MTNTDETVLWNALTEIYYTHDKGTDIGRTISDKVIIGCSDIELVFLKSWCDTK